MSTTKNLHMTSNASVRTLPRNLKSQTRIRAEI